MTDRPILFSAPMVSALLAGTKTQTRRILKSAPHWERILPSATWRFASGYKTTKANPPWMEATIPTSYGAIEILALTRVAARPGDRLWVREAWRPGYGAEGWRDDLGRVARPADFDPATTAIEYLATDEGELNGKNRPGIHMPRWASRLTLTVSEVRVQRLQDISEEDALAEGVSTMPDMPEDVHRCWVDMDPATSGADWIAGYDGRDVYRQLWHEINGAGSWDANPWVAAYSFETHRQNIDALANRPACVEA